MAHPEPTVVTPDQQGEAAPATEPSGSLLPVTDTEPQSREQHLEERKPRITGMAHTAQVQQQLPGNLLSACARTAEVQKGTQGATGQRDLG